MKYKTSELEGDRLDVAVAKAEGWAEQEVAAMLKAGDAADRYFSAASWGLAGPIIARERIDLESPELEGDPWGAIAWGTKAQEPGGYCATASGPTPLIAAMRAYVASKFGEEVELP